MVTRAVDLLKLDWPHEQENPKRSKLDDRFLSRGQGEGPQRRSLPLFGDLHDELVHGVSPIRPMSSCHRVRLIAKSKMNYKHSLKSGLNTPYIDSGSLMCENYTRAQGRP